MVPVYKSQDMQDYQRLHTKVEFLEKKESKTNEHELMFNYSFNHK